MLPLKYQLLQTHRSNQRGILTQIEYISEYFAERSPLTAEPLECRPPNKRPYGGERGLDL